MKVVTLVENTSGCDYLSSEHGLSVYLEFNGKRILFDMGQSRLFSENARMLGVDLSEVDVAVLSHGHYDHGGGLGEFLKINNKARVYLSSYAFEEHYNGKEKYIGLEKALMNSERLCFVDDVMDLFDGVKLYSAKQVPFYHGAGCLSSLFGKEKRFFCLRIDGKKGRCAFGG